MDTQVGFTGTRLGMTPAQFSRVFRLLAKLKTTKVGIFHHGDCVGADFQAATIAKSQGYYIIGHPPTDTKLKGYFPYGEFMEPLPYLERNRNIVGSAETVVAAPAEPVEVLRSGTWATARYAEAMGRKLYIVLPDGTVTETIPKIA